jgi:hypothetical protein
MVNCPTVIIKSKKRYYLSANRAIMMSLFWKGNLRFHGYGQIRFMAVNILSKNTGRVTCPIIFLSAVKLLAYKLATIIAEAVI